MITQEQAQLDGFYQSMLKALKRQGMSEKTIDSYARAVTRLAGHFGKCPDTLNEQDLKTYFDHLVEIRSWSTEKVDRCALQFF